MSSPSQRTLFWAVALLVGIAYAADFARFAPAALQDFPNHLARATLIDDLVFHGGREFGQAFEFHAMAVPYFLHDLLFASTIELLGVKAGAVAWVALVLLSLPFALVTYARATGLRSEDEPLLFLLGLYVATNAAFCRGFLAYCLALAVTLLALSAAQVWRERGTALAVIGYCTALCAGYFIHLTALVFIAVAVAASAVLQATRRELRVSSELPLLVPIGALLYWYWAQRHSDPDVFEWMGYYWAGIPAKLQHIDWAFIRFNRRIDHAILGLALLCLLMQAWARRPRSAPDRAHSSGMLALAGTFLVLYFALPNDAGMLSWVDVRALPMMALFLVLALCQPRAALDVTKQGAAPLREAWTHPPLVPFALGLALAGANLAYLHHSLERFDSWLGHYRDIVATLPADTWVLPVYTNTRDRPVKSTLHAAATTFLDRRAENPYLFSRDLGDAMPYFAYRRRPYAPDEDWYLRPAEEKVDWKRIAESYRYLLVMKPYDPARIPIRTTPLSENSAAVLLEVGVRTSMSQQRPVHHVE